MVHAFSFSFTVVHIKTQKPPTFTDYRTLTLYYVVYVADASARAAAHAHCAARRNAKEWCLGNKALLFSSCPLISRIVL